jgi:ABC-2 type transport system ATP-binding protein
VTAVAAHGLTKRYGGGVTAVDSLDLTVHRGEIYALLGLNGAGKTTTIRMLLGMIRPTAGTVSLLDQPVRPESPLWSQVGYLVETPVAYRELTVWENLEIVRRLRRVPDRDAVDETIVHLGLQQYAHRPAGTLSLGNMQRLGLAKALIHRPELLILDEPANGLDPAGVVEIRHLLADLAADHGVTIFLSSHILTEVARLATRIGVIHNARLVRELHANDLATLDRPRLVVGVRDPAAATAVLAAAGRNAHRRDDGTLVLTDDGAVAHPDAVATLLVAAGCPPTRLAVEHDDLETYFLRLIGTGDD